VTVNVIQKGNHLSGSVIRPGDRLRVFTGKFAIRISKKDNTLTLFMNDRFFKRYAVGTGEYGKTPVGHFTIRDRVPQPTWWKNGKAIPYGDTNNVLGTYWLALDIAGFGIHGTWQPETIGKQASAGCVRLINAEIEELFTLVPVGTPVTIME
jgi:lipoprotein-anchoring transpeptidase ErfK/SrfK